MSITVMYLCLLQRLKIVAMLMLKLLLVGLLLSAEIQIAVLLPILVNTPKVLLKKYSLCSFTTVQLQHGAQLMVLI